jgi:predicted transcriptional regulator
MPVSLGLMENYQTLNNQVYSVTEKGIEAVKTLLLSTI